MLKGLYSKLKMKLYEWVIYEPPSNEIIPYDFNRLKNELRPGDVLLIAGRSRVSKIIRSVTQSPWTHASLYIGRLVDYEDEEMVNSILKSAPDTDIKTRIIIEDVLDKGTNIMPLSVYSHHHIRICRPIGITPGDLDLVIRNAVSNLGQPYNVKHLIDLARFLLPWTILPKHWGSCLFRTSNGEPDSGICSSLIAEAFLSVQFPVLPYIKPNEKGKGIEIFHRNPYLFTPKDFDYSPYFEIIKYPLFNPGEPLPYYRRLPWKTGLLHQDFGVLTEAQSSTKKKSRLFNKEKTKKIAEKPDDPRDK